jgi:hydrogenase maturation factor
MKQDALKQHVEKLRAYDLNRDVRIMEVCGTHTTEFFRSGEKSLFPER